MRASLKASVALFGVLPLVAVAACSSGPPPGELVVEVDTDMSLPKDIDQVRVQILGTNGVTYNDQTYTVGPDGLHIPATIGVLAASPTDTALVRVTAIHAGKALVLREATSEVPATRQALLRVPLEFLCIGSAIDSSMLGSPSSDTITDSCPTGQTCVEGACQSYAFDVTKLPTYTPGLVFGGGDGGGGGTCFDTTACFASIETVTPDASCTVAVPLGVNAADLNVGLSTGSLGEPGICGGSGPCIIPVDMGGSDGWTLSGSRIQLPAGVCNPLNKSNPFTVVLSTSCPSKLPSVPTCGPWSSVGSADKTVDGGKVPHMDGGKDATVHDGSTDASRDAMKDGMTDAGLPPLLSLGLPNGITVTPGFSPTKTVYTVLLSASSLGSPLVLRPTAPPGYTITLTATGLTDGGTPENLSIGDAGATIAPQLLTPVVLRLTSTPPDPDGSTPPGTTYVLTVPAMQEAYIKSFNGSPQALLGTSVAIASDGNTLAVGAPGDRSDATGINGDGGQGSGTNVGAVYVYARTEGDGGGIWTQQAFVKASSPGGTSNFGNAVALSASGDTLAVGSSGQPTTTGGAAYVFRRSGTTWTQLGAGLVAEYGSNTEFGSSVALSANGDTLAVGALDDASGATGINGDGGQNTLSFGYAGAVYVFSCGDAGPVYTQTSYVKAPNTGPSAAFGQSVALSGDGKTLAVGASGEASLATGVDGDGGQSPGVSNAGAVYVFPQSGSSWGAPVYIKAPNTYKQSYFGASVALSNDGTVLAVGAWGESSPARGLNGNEDASPGLGTATATGAVYVFSRSSGTWNPTPQYFKASNPQADALFGTAVALSADGGALVVGAPGDPGLATGINSSADATAPETEVGAAYVFSLDASTWNQAAYVKPLYPPTSMQSLEFGNAITLSANGTTLAVGTPDDKSPATVINGSESPDAAFSFYGAVHVYR